MKRIWYAVILSFILLSVAACSKKNRSGNSTSAPAPSDFEALTEIKDGRPDVYLILKLIDSSYWQVMIKGAKEAGEVYDCNIYCAGTSIETDWKGQRLLIEEAMERNADALILSPDDSVELAPDIENVHDKGIPVVLIDTAANTESYEICYMTDNLLAGQNAAKEMLNQLKNAGHTPDENVTVGIVVGSAASQTINERLAGFYQYWFSNASEYWTIISDIKNCNGSVDEGVEMAGELLKDYSDISGLYATNNTPTRAICKAVSDSGRTDVVVVGFDYSDEIKELINSFEYRASTMLQRQYDMGYKGVGTAMDLLNGITPDVKFEDTGVVTVNRYTLNKSDVVEVLKNN